MDQKDRDESVVSELSVEEEEFLNQPILSRKVRERRRLGARSKTIAPRRLTKDEIRMRELLPVLVDDERPQKRGECQTGMRPCPYVTCKHHLYLDVNPETGSIKINFPDLEPWELVDTCALDVADRGGITLEEVGAILNLTRERIRQVEVRGLLKLKMVTPGEDDYPVVVQQPVPLAPARKAAPRAVPMPQLPSLGDDDLF